MDIREHIKLRGDDPLDATVAGTHYKAYLVANMDLNDSPQAAAEHYRIPPVIKERKEGLKAP